MLALTNLAPHFGLSLSHFLSDIRLPYRHLKRIHRPFIWPQLLEYILSNKRARTGLYVYVLKPSYNWAAKFHGRNFDDASLSFSRSDDSDQTTAFCTRSPDREITPEYDAALHVSFFSFAMFASSASSASPQICRRRDAMRRGRHFQQFATKFVHFTRPPPPPPLTRLPWLGSLYIYYHSAVAMDSKIKLISGGSSLTTVGLTLIQLRVVNTRRTDTLIS